MFNYRVTTLETQMKRMDCEMSLLGKAQVQYEQYKKRLEQQSRLVPYNYMYYAQ